MPAGSFRGAGSPLYAQAAQRPSATRLRPPGSGGLGAMRPRTPGRRAATPVLQMPAASPSARTHPAVARHPEHQPFHPYVDTAAAYVTSEMKRLRRTTKWDDRLPSCALMLAVEKKLPIVRHPARHAAVVQ